MVHSADWAIAEGSGTLRRGHIQVILRMRVVGTLNESTRCVAAQ